MTVKTTIIFTSLFAVAMLLYTIFLINSIHNRLGAGNDEYFDRLWVTTIILMIIVVALTASIGALASQYMLSPIRSMAEQLNGITSENLDARIDISETQDELMDLTMRINTMLADLERSFMRQKNFVSDASHELRTPIAVIQGYINLLRRWGKEKPEILEEAIVTIAREADNMKHLTEQLLFLTGVGTVKPVIEQFDVNLLLEEVLATARNVGQQTFVLAEDPPPIMLKTNRELFGQALRILLENAIKYTPEDGKIELVARLVGNKIRVSVKDSGIGITPEDLPHIFDRFYRCDKARTRAKGGSGLGLAIASSIMDVLGGTIGATSTVGEGSEFTLSMMAEIYED